MRRLTTFVLLAVLPPLAVHPAGAQTAPTPAPSTSAGASTSADDKAKIEEAQRRYANALELFNEGSFDAALLSFRRAYELAPNWRVLYNIGQVNVQLNDYAHALSAFEGYLREGGNDVPPARVAEVKAQIDRLHSRVAYLEISVNSPNAEITIDDLPIDKATASKPIVINVGRRKVWVNAPSRLPQTRLIEATGGDRIKLQFDLVAPESSPSGPIVEPPPPPPPSKIFWPGWIATGALGVGAVVTGILAVNAASSYDDKRDQFGIKRDELNDARDKSVRLNVITDVLLGATVIAGGVSLYLSLRHSPSATTGGQPRSTLGVAVAPSGFQFKGSF